MMEMNATAYVTRLHNIRGLPGYLRPDVLMKLGLGFNFPIRPRHDANPPVTPNDVPQTERCSMWRINRVNMAQYHRRSSSRKSSYGTCGAGRDGSTARSSRRKSWAVGD